PKGALAMRPGRDELATERPTERSIVPPATDVDAADVEPGAARRMLYQELFDFAPEPLLLTDSSGVIRDLNYAAADLLRAGKMFLLDKPFGFFIAQPDWQTFYSRLASVPFGHAEPVTDWPLRVRPMRGPWIEMMARVGAVGQEHGTPRELRWQLRPLSDRE